MRLSSPVRGLKRIRGTPVIGAGLAASLVLNAFQWIYLVVRVKPSVEPIPLHYNITFGIDRIGPWYGAFLLSIAGTMIVITNTVLTAVVIEHQRIAAHFIVALSIVMQIILVAGALLVFKSL